MSHRACIVLVLAAAAFGWPSAFAQTQPAAPATQATMQPVTLITLRAESRPAGDVLQEIARQAGVSLSIPRDIWTDGIPKITVIADRRPYWDTALDACKQAGVSVAPSRQRNTLAIVPRQAGTVVVSSGPFLGQLNSVSLVDRIDYATEDRRVRQATLNLSILCDPAMRILGYDPLELIEAVTDDGAKPPLPAPAPLSPKTGSADSVLLNAQLRLPDVSANVRRFRLVRFAATVQIQSQPRSVEWADLGKPETRATGGWTLSFKQRVTVNGGNTLLQLSVIKAPEGLQNIDTFNGVRVVDKNGLELVTAGGTRRTGIGDFGAQFAPRTASGEPTGEPVKLIWEVPTALTKSTTQLELKDVELGAR